MQPVINARLHDLQPTASAQLARANDAAWDATDPALLELCRGLVLKMLEAGAASHAGRAVTPAIDPPKLAALGNWASSDVFSPLERAALGFTEQFVLSVSSVSDEQVEALRAHLDDEAVYNFAAALYLVEMTERLKLVSRAVIGEEAIV
jgi:hypothetical protein